MPPAVDLGMTVRVFTSEGQPLARAVGQGDFNYRWTYDPAAQLEHMKSLPGRMKDVKCSLSMRAS